jgi:serine/threonine protein phosphatase 1
MNRQFAVADIHGCVNTFHTLLTKIGFSEKDTLFILGDCIDRGPDSKGVLDTLMGLAAKGYDVRTLRGNHEDMLLRTIKMDHDEFSLAWQRCWGEATLSSFKINSPSEIPEQYFRFISEMPLLLTNEDFVFVHATLAKGDDPLSNSSVNTMLWGETWLGKEFLPCGRRIVSGHRPVTLNIINETLVSRHILIDNGCFTGLTPEKGNLIAINLETLELTTQPLVDHVTNPWDI